MSLWRNPFNFITSKNASKNAKNNTNSTGNAFEAFPVTSSPFTVRLTLRPRNRSESCVHLSRVEFISPKGTTVAPEDVWNPNGITTPATNCNHLLSGDTSSDWVDSNIDGEGAVLEFQFKGNESIHSIRLWTASGSPLGDPIVVVVDKKTSAFGNWERVVDLRVDPPTDRGSPYPQVDLPHDICSSSSSSSSLDTPSPAAVAASSPPAPTLSPSAARSYVVRMTVFPMGQSAGCVQMSKIEFFAAPKKGIFSSKSNERIIPVKVENPRGRNPYHERCINLLNNSTSTKWLDSNISSGAELLFLFESAPPIHSYRLYTANDAPQRDPSRWTLELGPPEAIDWRRSSTEWELLDTVEPLDVLVPSQRFSPYPTLEITHGKPRSGGVLDMVKMPEPHEPPVVPPTMLRCAPDKLVWPMWCASTFVHEEFKDVTETIALSDPLFRTSRLWYAYEKFQTPQGKSQGKEDMGVAEEEEKQASGENECELSLEQTIKACISKAYGSSSHMKRHYQSSLMQYYGSMGWRGPIFASVMRELARSETPDGLSVSLELLVTSQGQCMARKISSLHTIMMRFAPPSLPPTDETKARVMTHVAESRREMVASALSHLYEELGSFLDSYKLRAFYSAFLGPSMVYFDQMYNHTARDDVEVHGTNTYLATLMSCLHVQMPLLPLLDDDVKGCAPFLEGELLHPLYNKMLEPRFFGVDFRTVKRDGAEDGVYTGKYSGTRVFSGSSPLLIANQLHEKSASKLRSQMVPYLERFAGLFSEKYLGEKLFLHLTSNESHKVHLDHLFEHAFLPFSSSTDKELSDDVREWAYDTETYQFQSDRVARLFKFLGVFK